MRIGDSHPSIWGTLLPLIRKSLDLPKGHGAFTLEGAMNNGELLVTNWALIESAAKDEFEEGFRVVSGGGPCGLESRTIHGVAALRSVLFRLAPRRIVLDFETSFRLGLAPLRELKSDFPALYVLARGRALSSDRVEALHFSVELRRSGVSLRRVNAEADGPPPPLEDASTASEGLSSRVKLMEDVRSFPHASDKGRNPDRAGTRLDVCDQRPSLT